MQNQRGMSELNGRGNISLAIIRQPGVNTVEVSEGVRETLEELKPQLPAGIRVEKIYDKADSIEESVNDVKFTMVVSILSMACWRLGFSYLLCVRMGWGAVGVWVAMVIDWTCRVTCFVLRFRSGAWKTKYQA